MVFNDTKVPGELIRSSDWNSFVDFTEATSGNAKNLYLASSSFLRYDWNSSKWHNSSIAWDSSLIAWKPIKSGAAGTGTDVAWSGASGYTSFSSNTKINVASLFAFSTNSFRSGASYINELADVDTQTTTPTTDQVLKWNGTTWVPAAYNATYAFSIASFSDDVSSPVLIGAVDTWKAIGAVSFSATYTNGPATSAHVEQLTEWTGVLTVDPVAGPETNTEIINYPASPGTRTFTLHAIKDSESDTETHTVAFYNYIFYGVSTKENTYLETDVEGLVTSTISDTKGRTISVTASATQYILYCVPVRLGTVTFTVNGFTGGFQNPETVNVTNSSKYAEDYYVYRSTNKNLGTVSIVVV